MRPRTVLILLVWLFALSGRSYAQEAVYRPLGSWIDPRIDSFLRWDTTRQLQEAAPSLSKSSRPQLAGLRPKNFELLEDALRRKAATKITTTELAEEHILRLARFPAGQNVLNGGMAEALFADRNPDWNYVRSPNAPQHDFTRPRLGGGPPENVQVKFHRDGNPATYIRDMGSDWRAHRFAVPDDHFDAIHARLGDEYRRLNAIGDLDGANRAAQDLGRLRRGGFTSQEVIDGRKEAFGFAARQKYATYFSFGASLILALGPTAWDAVNGRISSETAVYRVARTLSLLGVGIDANLLLQTIKRGALRGTLRGNLVTGAAIEIADITWLLYEHGWGRAFNDPDFYEGVVGGISGLGVGTVTMFYVTAAASETGPWAPVIGFGASVVTGTIAYIGGSSATRKIIQLVAPEMLRQHEREQLTAVKSEIEQRISLLQTWPPKALVVPVH
jgi:hypothetical protein